MLPLIKPEPTQQDSYQEYLLELAKSKFSGEIRSDYAARLTVATDNSVYQVIPAAVILPKTTADIALALKLSQQEKFQTLKFVARGGGTGTNGQALSAGIVIDCSKYMREILEINHQENWVRVQPGVVLDQLNLALKNYGMHFPPEISPSNRATLGGMINTDACGNGSKTIGRTSDYVLDLTCVLSNGQVINTDKSAPENLVTALTKLLAQKQKLIQEKFISRPRNLNGYNLLKAYQEKIDLNYLLCGSEGTLAIISECKLKIKPIPQFKKLVLVKYKNFNDALKDNIISADLKPLVIETIDEKLLELARTDDLYFKIKTMLDTDVKPGAINLLEFVETTETNLTQKIQTLIALITHGESTAIGQYIATNNEEMKLLWDLRKKSVGLISKNLTGTRRPIPFIEDTAVPPEHLAAYILEFKKLLDQHALVYGMYGHVDAGCVHVRPALDLKIEADEKLFVELSNAVVALVQKYQGVMWGEHGMGFRSGYAKEFFGDELYAVVKQIKQLFDPLEKLNPGKIVSLQDNLVKLNTPLRAHYDKQISAQQQSQFAGVMSCNGNGACFNYSTQETMCPSFKVTKERIHSPKGRSVILREWLRLFEHAKQPAKKFTWLTSLFAKLDFSKEVYTAMNGCLSCKACASQCPLNIDIPSAKSNFLALYHQRYWRPLRDYLIANLEFLAPWQQKFSRINNYFVGSALVKTILKKGLRVVDLPLAATHQPIPFLNNLSDLDLVKDKTKAVILLQDAFTSFYEENLLTTLHTVLTKMGFIVFVLPFFPNGKPAQVKGFLKQFSKIALKNINYLRKIAEYNIPIVGIDPSITLTYRDEYTKLAGQPSLGFKVNLLQEWLSTVLIEQPEKPKEKTYYLLSHCTEKTAVVAAEKQWIEIFASRGLTLIPIAVGCCGMAGSYGHEAEHRTLSSDLFKMDWQKHIENHPNAIVATGYSCRSQVKRLMKLNIPHPIEVI